MAIEVTHPFVSNKGDGSDATLVRPSNWNENHKVELSANKIIGRVTAGFGDAEELPVSAYMIGLLNHPDFAALAQALGLPITGDVRLTFHQDNRVGWVIANDGSIGDEGSGATTRAWADTWPLFYFFFHTMWEGFVPLQNSSGGVTTRAAHGNIAENAWNAKCRMVLPKTLGRAVVAGNPTGVAGVGLSVRWPGEAGGAETHTLTIAQLPRHRIGFSGTLAGTATGGASCGSGSASVATAWNATVGATNTNHYHSNYTSGGVTGTGQWLHSHGITFKNQLDQSVQALGSGVAYNNAGHGGGGAYAPPVSTSIGNADLNHGHGHDISIVNAAVTAHGSYPNGISHTHGIGSLASSGSCTVDSITVNISSTATCSGYTDYIGSDSAVSNMQPYIGMTVLVKL